ncbi:hypothetical protein H5410_047951 [Solanum commersonii]|uniref:Uncharacterized protein n=1 Tax=Solanum commersonii TaxID=4109 RepID=A0A9J5XIE8_SOLCO|nr:hypothetical protein H5410_047951 [Solanum commersonii]
MGKGITRWGIESSPTKQGDFSMCLGCFCAPRLIPPATSHSNMYQITLSIKVRIDRKNQLVFLSPLGFECETTGYVKPPTNNRLTE